MTQLSDLYSGSSSGLTWVVKVDDYTASNNDGILADTTTSGFILTLPLDPSISNLVGVIDYATNFATTSGNLIIDRNGENIMGLSENLICNINDAAFELIYSDVIQGWKIK